MPDLTYDKQRPLYLWKGGSETSERYTAAQSREALEAAYTPGLPVLIYIHGRAKGAGEPRKGVNNGTYTALANYGVSVLGFTWDADDGGYDVTRPLATEDEFDRLLNALAAMLAERNGELPKPALLAHSMGNLLVQEVAEDGKLSAASGALFSNIILNAAAVESKRHHLWLDAIGASERKYVLFNRNDWMLKLLTAFAFDRMLGRRLSAPAASPAQTTYVDVAPLNVNHMYFVPSRQEKSIALRAFFTEAIAGKAVDLSNIAERVQMDGVSVQRLLKTPRGPVPDTYLPTNADDVGPTEADEEE
jgi:hypothetical protein